MDEADRLAARLAIVDRGRIVVEGTAAELKSALAGDRIEIALLDGGSDGAEAQRALERVDGVGEVAVAHGMLQTRARDGGAAIPAVLAALEEHGVGVASVTIARPSLDDVYLRHAGRSFSAAEREIKEVAA
jgi:ABC-2 type transport system ATP-binding protein